MNGFIAIAGNSPSGIIQNAPFWPDVDLAVLSEVCRKDGTVTAARLRQAVINAMSSINRELSDWRQTQLAAGFACLSAVPAPFIDEISILISHYLTAVYSTVEADIREKYRDYDATADGHKHTDRYELSVDDLRRNARWAIADIQGKPHAVVELI